MVTVTLPALRTEARWALMVEVIGAHVESSTAMRCFA
jgi:hypothetical protein